MTASTNPTEKGATVLFCPECGEEIADGAVVEEASSGETVHARCLAYYERTDYQEHALCGAQLGVGSYR